MGTTKTSQNPLVGKKGRAEIIQIFAVVSTTGRDLEHHLTERKADVGARGWSLEGGAQVQPRLAVRFGKEYFLLTTCTIQS